MAEKSSAIIVAGGMGTRLGADMPKAFVLLGGTPLFVHALRVFDTHPSVSEVVLVIPPGRRDETNELLADVILERGICIAEGGEQRWHSVANGLAACRSSAPWVMVHDSARPFVTKKVIDDLLAMQTRYQCAVTATPEVDTIRRVQGDRALETLDRTQLVRVGTPQLFAKSKLREALALAPGMNPPPTDEGMLMERLGLAVGIAPGDPLNFKVTTPQDLLLAEALVRSRS